MGEKKSTDAAWGFVGILVLIAVFVSSIWTSTHPTRAETNQCIRAGYDVATYETMFGYDVVCRKTVIVPLSEIEKELK